MADSASPKVIVEKGYHRCHERVRRESGRVSRTPYRGDDVMTCWSRGEDVGPAYEKSHADVPSLGYWTLLPCDPGTLRSGSVSGTCRHHCLYEWGRREDTGDPLTP